MVNRLELCGSNFSADFFLQNSVKKPKSAQDSKKSSALFAAKNAHQTEAPKNPKKFNNELLFDYYFGMIAYTKFVLSKSENCTAGVSYTLQSATQSTGETVKTADYPRFLKRRMHNWQGSKRGEYFLNFRPWMGKPAQNGLIGFLVNYIDDSTVAMYSDNALLRQGLSYGYRDWNAYIMRRQYDRMTIYRCLEKDFHALLEKIKEDN